jgi:hypothetical protein
MRVKMKKVRATPSGIFHEGAIVDVSEKLYFELMEDNACELVGPADPAPGTAYEDGEKFAAAQAQLTASKSTPEAIGEALPGVVETPGTASNAPTPVTGESGEPITEERGNGPEPGSTETITETGTVAAPETAVASVQADRTRTRRTARPAPPAADRTSVEQTGA